MRKYTYEIGDVYCLSYKAGSAPAVEILTWPVGDKAYPSHMQNSAGNLHVVGTASVTHVTTLLWLLSGSAGYRWIDSCVCATCGPVSGLFAIIGPFLKLLLPHHYRVAEYDIPRSITTSHHYWCVHQAIQDSPASSDTVQQRPGLPNTSSSRQNR